MRLKLKCCANQYSGVSEHVPLERHLRSVRVGMSKPSQSQTQKLISSNRICQNINSNLPEMSWRVLVRTEESNPPQVLGLDFSPGLLETHNPHSQIYSWLGLLLPLPAVHKGRAA